MMSPKRGLARPLATTRRRLPQKVRRPAPDAYRLKRAKGLSRRRRGLSFPAKAILVVALVVLGVAVFMTASGGVGKLVGALGNSMFGFVDKIGGDYWDAPWHGGGARDAARAPDGR